MSSYEALAASYDGLMADASYCRRAAFLDRLLKKSVIPVHSVLDLACGTGTISCLLAQQGYQQHAASGSFIRRNQLDFCYERSQPPTPQAHFEMKL